MTIIDTPTEHLYPTYVAVDNPSQAADGAPTHHIYQLTQGGTYRRKIAACWSVNDAVQTCDALNRYPPRTKEQP